MERLARRILLVVGLFVLVVASMMVVRRQGMDTEALGPRPSAADLSIKEVQLHEESREGEGWQLVADQASVFDEEGRTSFRRIRLRVHDRGRVWTINGDEGDYFKNTNNFEVRRNVVMTSDDGVRLETSVLRWKGDERRLWTDQPVQITREGTVVQGTALDVLMAEESTTVKGRVRVTFTQRPSS